MQESKTTFEKLDFISNLNERFLAIAEQILSLLDIKSLKSAEAVSKDWYSVIYHTRLWEKLYLRESMKSSTLDILLQRRIAEGFKKDDPFFLKRMLNSFGKIQTNWRTGNFAIKTIDVGRCSRFVMDDNRLVVIDSTLSVTLWNRWTFEREQLPLQSDSTLSELTDLGLYKNFVFCSYRDGTVVVWDLTEKCIHYRFKDNEMSGCDLKIHIACDILVSYVSLVSFSGNDQTRFTVRSIENPFVIISKELTDRAPCARVYNILSDDNYIIIFLLCSNDYIVSRQDFKIQLRSIVDFQAIREVSNVMTSREIFTYFNGWLLVGGKDEREIRVWDIVNEICRFRIKTDDDSGLVDVRYDGHHVIVRHSSGMFYVWRFQLGQNVEPIKANFEIVGERIKRGYQHFRFDQLQILSVHNNESSLDRHDVLTIRDFSQCAGS